MPKFKVLCRVDAFVDYTAQIEAETPEEAARLAEDGLDEYEWTREGETEFDARVYVALDAEEREIEATQCGDFGWARFKVHSA